MSFRDPDGMRLAIIGVPGIAEQNRAWTGSDVPAELRNSRLPQRQPAC